MDLKTAMKTIRKTRTSEKKLILPIVRTEGLLHCGVKSIGTVGEGRKVKYKEYVEGKWEKNQ